MNVWAVVKLAVREFFSPMRTAWFLIFIGAGLLASDIMLRLLR